MNKTRLEAFSDGVFAIIITIMVLEIKIPHGSKWGDLLPLRWVFGSYLMSFIYVGIYWGNHHHMLHSLKHVSPGVIWANMGLLFSLSLVPFATGWMGENHFAPNTVSVYSALLLVCGLTYTVLQKFVERHALDIEQLQNAFEGQRRKGTLSTLGYIAAIPLAYVSPPASVAIIWGIAIIWLIPDKNIEQALKKE